MPAGAAIIGRVAVKVLPDTTDFRRDTERKLSVLEKSMKFQIATSLDMTGASRQFLEELQKINARNRANDSRKIRFHTTISTNGMRDAVTSARRKLQALADQNQIDFRVDNLDVGAVVGRMELDEDSLRDVKNQIDRWKRKVSPVKIEVKTDFASTAGAATSARLAILTRPRTVPIIPQLDNTALARVGTALAALSGARVIADAFSDMGTALKELDKAVPKIAALATSVFLIAGYGLTAASNMSALAGSIVAMAPAAIALPGIFAGLGVGLGITVMALKDMKKALPDVAEKFAAMKHEITRDFWSAASAGIRDLANVYLPHLADSASKVGEFWGKFAAALSKPFHDALGPMFDNLNKSIDIMIGGTGQFAGVITQLGLTGSQYLPRLAQWFVDINTRFNEWLAKAAVDGRLNQFVDTAIKAMSDLGTVVLQIGRIFNGVFKAAEQAGGSTLSMIAETLTKVANVVNSEPFQTTLVSVFSAAHEAMSQIARISGPSITTFFSELGRVLTIVLPMVGTVVGTLLKNVADALTQPAFTGGLIEMFQGIETAVLALSPAFRPLGQALGALGPVIGHLAANIAPAFAAALMAVSGAVTSLAPVLVPLIDMLGQTLLSAITQLTPFFGQLVVLIGTALTQAISALTPVMPSLVTALVTLAGALVQIAVQVLPILLPVLPELTKAFVDLLVAITPLIPVFTKLVIAVLVPMVEAVTGLAINFLPKLVTAFTSLVTALTPVIQAVTGLVQVLAPVLIPVLKFLAQVLLETVVMAINCVKDVIVGATNFIKGVIDVFIGIFTLNWTQFWNGIKEIASGVWDLIKGALELFFSIGILGAVAKGLIAVKVAFEGGWLAIRAVFGAAFDSLLVALRGFLSFIKGEPGVAMKEVTSLFRTAWAEIKGVFEFAWAALKQAVKDGVESVIRFHKEMPGKILDAIGDLGGLLKGAGQAVIDGFISGIRSAFDRVKSTLSELTSMLPDWKGPADKDKVLLVNAGQLVIDGFISGLESRYDAVRKSLRGLTVDVANTTIPAPQIGAFSSPTGVGSGLMSRVANGSDGSVQKVLNYYAAPGSSLGSEEDLFAAASRTRMVGW